MTPGPDPNKFWRLKVAANLEIWLSRDPKSRFPIRFYMDKPATSLDSEELDWLVASFFFVRKYVKQSLYRYEWVLSVPAMMRVSPETRHRLGVIERSFKGGRDLDLTVQA